MSENVKDVILDLWSKNWSAGQIEQELVKRGLERKSRNSIVGIAARAREAGDPRGIGGRPKPKPAVKPKPKRLPKSSNVLSLGGMWKGARAQKVQPQFMAPENPDNYEKVTLMELRPNHCRYPIGEVGHESFRFCGAPMAARSYCLFHYQLSYERRITS